ncbi:MAG: zinc-ribbon domain-containing protein [Lachnospiraceae bacterium]|nr:zinc-ribbon domain-containing protein [Lachnospiraceae bacterium]
MKHYKNLMSALGDAMPMCLAWRLAGTEDNYFNARDLFAFALSDDHEEGSLQEGQFYLVSAEGAIGISSGYEYFVNWLFIPLEGDAYEKEVQRLKNELALDAVPQPTPQASPQTMAQAMPQQAMQQSVPPQVMQQPIPQQANPQMIQQPQNMMPQGKPRFCRSCGTQLKPNAKFCPGCGTPIA